MFSPGALRVELRQPDVIQLHSGGVGAAQLVQAPQGLVVPRHQGLHLHRREVPWHGRPAAKAAVPIPQPGDARGALKCPFDSRPVVGRVGLLQQPTQLGEGEVGDQVRDAAATWGGRRGRRRGRGCAAGGSASRAEAMRTGVKAAARAISGGVLRPNAGEGITVALRAEHACGIQLVAELSPPQACVDNAGSAGALVEQVAQQHFYCRHCE
jgi:hypothetical protein